MPNETELPLVSGDEVRDLVKDYGMVIVDECHHVSAVSFERVLKEVNAKYIYGLTATPARQDGHQPIIHIHSVVNRALKSGKRVYDPLNPMDYPAAGAGEAAQNRGVQAPKAVRIEAGKDLKRLKTHLEDAFSGRFRQEAHAVQL